MTTIRLTVAQALVRWLSVQRGEGEARFIDGVWAIFGHGNVAGLGAALHEIGDALPTWRGQNEQTMAHAAIAYAKAMKRRRAQAVTTSIGPGATNVVTAAALAHVNRLPLLILAGDVFASRRPDPVLQQIEDFDDGTVTANDCFRPVVRYFDRITRPEQILTALPRAMRVMTDPANCGPVCLALCQDVQAEAHDWPVEMFAPRLWPLRRPEPDRQDLDRVAELIRAARRPVILCGGGVIYSGAEAALGDFASRHSIPVTETQAGKSALPQAHPMNFGAAGVDGAASANAALAGADLVLGIGTRLQDFTTGSRTLFAPGAQLVSVNVQGYDAAKQGALPLICDARVALDGLSPRIGDYRAAPDTAARANWLAAVAAHCAAPRAPTDPSLRPSDAQVIGAVRRAAGPAAIALGAAGTMPGALKLLWQAGQGGYHMEYGYSCMGYEIAAAMGVKLALPEREVICFVGDGSYMMANSELATAVMRRIPFTVVLTDNRGFGCINRLQTLGCGAAPFNNLYADSRVAAAPQIDYAAHAAAMGAHALAAPDLATLEAGIAAARRRDIPSVIVIETAADHFPGTGMDSAAGPPGHFWDVALPQTGGDARQRALYRSYLDHIGKARLLS